MLAAFSFFMNFDHAQFTAHFTRWFSTTVGVVAKSQIDNANTLLRFIEADTELTNLQHASYILATAAWETGYKFAPVYERGSRHYFDKYEGRHDLGNTHPGDGFRFRGRGQVQLTGFNNYTRFGDELNIDLIGNPDLALDPQIAYQIMSLGMRKGLFTGKKLSDFINASKCDYTKARRIINGNDKAATIARIAAGMEATLRASTRVASTSSAQPQATDAPANG